jgi:mono/diheme cytochrome c family protein
MNGRIKRSTVSALVSIAGATFLLTACGGSSGSRGADVSRGREHYMTTCALCHGADGEGKARLGKALQANSFVDSLSDEELVVFLKEGRPSWDPANERGVDMPPKGGNPALTDENLMQIVTYLRTL